MEGTRLTTYFELLDERSNLKQQYREMLSSARDSARETRALLEKDLREKVVAGEIDVNIMTKLDRTNYEGEEPLPREFPDAVAALRGYANSTLQSSVVFSAGINPRLYTSLAEHEDFFVTEEGESRKKVIVKVSDYRSALTQGRFLGKKGIWVSEFRIESSLNRGGHAFPNDGVLLGPILEEFKNKREELTTSLFDIYDKAMRERGVEVDAPPTTRFSVQGGVGTFEEHALLLNEYRFDSVGWGTPFLLVPEATTVDQETLERLVAARENDLYLSNASPLGVPFNNLRTSSSEETRRAKIAKGLPGSPCVNGYLATNTEFTSQPICVASRAYQKRKLDEIASSTLPEEEKKRQEDSVLAKACICFDLGAGAMLHHDIAYKQSLLHPAVCPGPNLAYFSGIYSLSEMVSHIYGRASVLNEEVERPHAFIKELLIYLDYLDDHKEELKSAVGNLSEGIAYYRALLPRLKFDERQMTVFLSALEAAEERLSAHLTK